MLIRFKNFLYFFHFLLFLSVFACGRESSPTPTVKLGSTYRIPIFSDITCLDPICGESHTWTIGSQIYEGLVTYARESANLIPLLAESYTAHDLSLTFHLRQGVKFHDDVCFPDGKGREFTAADVKYSIERFFKHRLGDKFIIEQAFQKIRGFKAFIDNEASHIEGLEIPDKYIFTIKFIEPDHELLWTLADHFMFVVPREAVEYYGESFKLHPVGTGPFRFSEIVPNEKLVLVKNKNYWGHEDGVRLPYLDAVEYVIYRPDETEKMLLDFQTGKIDECTQEVAPHLLHLAERDSLGHVKFKGWLKERGVQFVKDKAFHALRYLHIVESNKLVRQAMSYAINRQRLAKHQTSIFQTAHIAKGPLPPNNSYYNEIFPGQFSDPAKARELLEKSGFPGGKGLPEYQFISLPSPDVDCIVEDLAATGFRVKKSAPFPGWRNLLTESKPLLVRLMNINTSPKVYAAFDMFDYIKDAEFVNAYATWQKNAENRMLVYRLEEMAVDLSPMVFLYHLDGEFRFLQRYVRGRQLGNAWGHKLHYVWLDHGSS